MQINRLFEIIYILLNKGNATAGELAKHFEVSQRTIYRDVELLSSAGIPIYMTKGKGGGISLLPDFVLNKTVLTEKEKADILSALHAVDSVSLEQTNTAVKKLSSLFGTSDSDWIEVDFTGWANAEEESATFSTLKSAILEKNLVEFQYYGSNNNYSHKDNLDSSNYDTRNSSMKRVVEPLKLVFKGNGWYLYGYCRIRNDYRFFKLRRIKELTILSERFERPIPGKLFDGSKKYQADFVNLTLKISKEMAFRVYDEFSDYQVLSDGSFMAQISMPKGDWIYYFINTFGEHCEVIEPEVIRLQMKEKLQKTLEKYL